MSGFVYFIAPDVVAPNRVKIGFTAKNPQARMANLQTGSPEKLRLLVYVEAEQFLEGMLHEAFAPLRLHGEWFALDGKLLAMVQWMHHQRRGDTATWIDELQRAANQTLGLETPPCGVFCTDEQWDDSMVFGRLDDWLAEEAWKSYQARKIEDGQ